MRSDKHLLKTIKAMQAKIRAQKRENEQFKVALTNGVAELSRRFERLERTMGMLAGAGILAATKRRKRK